MNCHMHQPNIFLNSYLGYTMWDYESDAPLMWPEKQKYPTAEEVHETLERNPDGAAQRGKWSALDFPRNVYDDVNPKANHTHYADYPGHGRNCPTVFKHNSQGNRLHTRGKNDTPNNTT